MNSAKIWVALYNKDKELTGVGASKENGCFDLELTHNNVCCVAMTFDEMLTSIEPFDNKENITICRVQITNSTEMCKLLSMAMFGSSQPKITVTTDISIPYPL